MKFSVLILGLTAVCAAVPGRASAQNFVQNGDFSQTTYKNNSQFGTADGGTFGQGVTDWTGNSGYNLFYFNGTATTNSAASQYDSGYNTGSEKLYGTSTFSGSSPNKNNFVALDGDLNVGGGGGISQTINGLSPGSQYQLSFVWGASQLQSRTGITTEEFQVSLNNQIFNTPTETNPSGGFTGWFSEAYTFTATSASTLLSFLSQGTPSGEPPIALLTNVSLTSVPNGPTPVPEPATMSLLGAGIAGLLAARRRRRAQPA